MRVIRFHADNLQAPGMNPQAQDSTYPVRIQVFDSPDGVGEESIGFLRLGVPEAGLLCGILDLLAGLTPPDRLVFRWTGFVPPAPDLPLGKISKVLKLVGMK